MSEEVEEEKVVTVADLMKAIRLAAAFGVAGLVAVGLALAIFVASAASERQEICDVVVASVSGNAESLITATASLDRTPEEQANYDKIVSRYREQVYDALKGCH